MATALMKLHPRVRLIPDAFTPPMRRAMQHGFWGGLSIGLVVGIALVAIAPAGGIKTVALIVTVSLVSAGAGIAVRMATIPSTVRAPHEAFAWLGSSEVRRFQDRTGSKAPGTEVEMAPPGSTSTP